MRLVWYIKRLRSMGPAEQLHRALEFCRKVSSQYRDLGWQRYPSPTIHTVFGDLRRSVENATEDQRQAISAAANETLAGRFAALGRSWPPRAPDGLFPSGLWRLDPVTGGAWPGPDTYAFKVGFRHNDFGDIKYVWEINRLQFLPPLAAQFLLAADDRCLAAIEAAVDSWHGANPPYTGVGWLSGIEVALRAISLILTLDLVGDRLSDKARRQIGEILSASRYWLPRFPSLFSSANNHRIAELAGEYLISLALGSPSAKSRAGLLDEIEKQIAEDGTGVEQTPTYAAFSAELALTCAMAARHSGVAFPSSFNERLAAFADFVGWLDPNAIGYGDDDEGRVMTLGREADYKGSVAASIHGFLGQPGIAAKTGDFRGLFFGTPPASRERKEGLRTFRLGGLSVWRGRMCGRHVDFAFHHGPLGYLAIAAHGHADALSLTLAIDGESILIDPGTWQYGAGGIWRDWFRSTPAHNTLNIAGHSQSIIAGPFNWSHKAMAKITATTDPPDWQLTAEHDGYRRRFGVVHQRHLQRQADGIAITDRLIGGVRAANIVFQLPGGLSTQNDGDIVMIRKGGQALMRIQFPNDAIAIGRGGETPGQGGWASANFGVKLPADRIVWSGMVDDGGVITRLLL